MAHHRVETPAEVVKEGEQVKVKVLSVDSESERVSLSIKDTLPKANYYMDISVHGGHPIWFMQARDIGEVNVSLNEASKLAQAYLEEQGFENMQLVNSEQYDSIAMLDFVYVQDDYRIYPDSLVVEVALDEGDIIGYEAKDYLINHKEYFAISS